MHYICAADCARAAPAQAPEARAGAPPRARDRTRRDPDTRRARRAAPRAPGRAARAGPRRAAASNVLAAAMPELDADGERLVRQPRRTPYTQCAGSRRAAATARPTLAERAHSAPRAAMRWWQVGERSET